MVDNNETNIQNFYRDKNVFLTGGTGFLGKVFTEKLLRTTDVKCIYMLIRPKRGKDIQERINDILKDPLYERLLKLKPDAAKRIELIPGDCLLPNLGFSEEDLNKLIEHIDVVVHSAATVKFNEPLTVAFNINVRATMDLLQIAKQMKKLKSFVHVSSAFANCTEPHVEEVLYTQKLNITAENLRKTQEIVGEDLFNRMEDSLCEGYPNTYCYTKVLAEEAVQSQSKDLPICIFRPGIVIPTYKEPISGWSDNIYGPFSILFGACYGVLHVMYARMNSDADLIPVDLCANLMITSAWHTSVKSKEPLTQNGNGLTSTSYSTPPIYNLVPDKRNMLTWKMFEDCVEQYGTKMPLSRMIWYPFLITTDSKMYYKMLCLIYHMLPGYVMDFFLMLQGKKKRLVRTYEKIHHQTVLLEYFVEHSWTFSMNNTQRLWKLLTPDEQNLFFFDVLKIDWTQYFVNGLKGMRLYIAKEEPDTIPRGLSLYLRFQILHRTLQCLVVGSLGSLLLWTTMRIF